VYSDTAEGQSASVSNPTLLRIDVCFTPADSTGHRNTF